MCPVIIQPSALSLQHPAFRLLPVPLAFALNDKLLTTQNPSFYIDKESDTGTGLCCERYRVWAERRYKISSAE